MKKGLHAHACVRGKASKWAPASSTVAALVAGIQPMAAQGGRPVSSQQSACQGAAHGGGYSRRRRSRLGVTRAEPQRATRRPVNCDRRRAASSARAQSTK